MQLNATHEVNEEQFVRSVQRPALEYMNEDQLHNLERVLNLNRTTVQTAMQTESTAPKGQPSTQYNPYLYNSFQAADATVPYALPTTIAPEQKQATNPVATPQQQPLPAGYPPYVQYPFLPFWSACPLPFSPLSYPQIILPQPAYTTAQPIGQQLLRPVPVQNLAAMNSAYEQSKASYHRGQGVPTTPIAPHPPPSPPVLLSPSSSIPGSPQTMSSAVYRHPPEVREHKIDKYRDKRAKRNWSRNPDPKLSRMAQERPRDGNGKFISHTTSAEIQELKQELFQMKCQLMNTELELDQIRMRQNHDDMYYRSVNNVNVHAVQPFQVHHQSLAQSGVIYSPFRGGNTAVEAFKEKIDLATKRDSLKKTHSPLLPPGVPGGPHPQESWQDSMSTHLYEEEPQEWSQAPTEPSCQEAEKQLQVQWVDALLNNTYSSSDDEDLAMGM